MRKLMILILTVTLFSCGSSKTVRDSKKVIKGEWVLNSINYSEAGTFNVTLLDDASKKCFEYSTWRFIPNNNTGIYTINDSSCEQGDRYFVFTIQEVNEQTGLYDFLLKPTNEKGKSETNKGFRMRLSAISETSMQWQQTVYVEGDPFTITMNFNKL
ncbi:lipocalin family protein [Hanstruepera ponticola]|uniref:lipocalin family protein n=1 Tax=Hanstruepera ponticola TaxID=2042995 RepID=UPI000CF06A81|nr:lipocalin family protein [Hanstruepera ponticola]